jgi:hypothetical protein
MGPGPLTPQRLGPTLHDPNDNDKRIRKGNTMASKELIKEMARWEQQRRETNKGLAKDDRTPAISALGGKDLDNAAMTGKLEVTS